MLQKIFIFGTLLYISKLHDLDRPSAGSESIASTELQELEDNVGRLLCKLASNSFFDSTDPVSISMDLGWRLLPRPLMPTKRLQVSDPFPRIHNFLFNCSRRLWLSSDSPAICPINSLGISNAVIGVKSVVIARRSFTSITSVAMSSTKRLSAT